MTQPIPPADPSAEPQAATTGPGTAVAVGEADRPRDSAGGGNLPAAARERIAMQREKFREELAMQAEERSFLAAATKITWAKNLEPDALLKLAGYAKERDLDLLTEFHVLGGSTGYVNAKWYIRQLGNLVADDIVEFFYYDVVSKDSRLEEERQAAEDHRMKLTATLDALANLSGPGVEAEREAITADIVDAVTRERAKRKEIQRRADERIAHNLPEEAKAAVVWHVKVKLMAEEVVAAQAVGGYRGTKYKSAGQNAPPGANDFQVDKDPVGEEFPRETAITRGARKVMLALAHVSKRLKDKESDAREAAALIAAQIPELEVEARRLLRKAEAVPAVKDSHQGYGASSD